MYVKAFYDKEGFLINPNTQKRFDGWYYSQDSGYEKSELTNIRFPQKEISAFIDTKDGSICIEEDSGTWKYVYGKIKLSRFEGDENSKDIFSKLIKQALDENVESFRKLIKMLASTFYPEDEIEQTFKNYPVSKHFGDYCSVVCSFYDEDFPEDYHKNFLQLGAGKKYNNRECQYELAMYYYYTNYDLSFKWFIQAVKNGAILTAQIMTCSFLPFWNKSYPKKEFRWIKYSAERGDKFSYKYLAKFYLQGFGAKQSIKKAVYWYKKVLKQDESFLRNQVTSEEEKWIREFVINYEKQQKKL